MNIMKVSLILFLFLLAITVSFKHSTYSVSVNAGPAQSVLVLSKVTFVARVENGYLQEIFHSNMLVDSYCQLTRA